jgi:phosphatidylglycerophosphate synthase
MNNMHSYALICCAYAALSDVADKMIANLTNQRSPLNTTIDALSDRLLVMTGFIALYKLDIMSIQMVKSTVIRDFVIIGGGATIRYLGFESKPTLKQYLDINNYPTSCFKPVALNRLLTGAQYSVIMAHLAFNHLTGDPIYDWSIFLWQGFAMALSSMSIGHALVVFLQPRFLTKPPA